MSPTPMTQSHRDPQELKLHPLLKHQPGEWDEEDPRFKAFVIDIQTHGIQDPVIITAEGLIADGRRRWRAAKRLQLVSIPCRVCDDHEVPEIIVRTLSQRQHYTKGQLAYILAQRLDEAFESARRRMLMGTKGEPSKLSFEGLSTPDDYAATIGVSVQYLRQARKIHELFADDKKRKLNGEDGRKTEPLTLRDFYEPQILDPDKPIGLGGVIAGIASIIDAEKKGKPHKGGKPDDQNRQIELFNKVVADELNRWEYWQKFDPETKAAHFKSVRAKAAQISDANQLEEMADYHSKLSSEFRRAAKEAAAANSDKN
jgi:gas vesicle protein